MILSCFHVHASVCYTCTRAYDARTTPHLWRCTYHKYEGIHIQKHARMDGWTEGRDVSSTEKRKLSLTLSSSSSILSHNTSGGRGSSSNNTSVSIFPPVPIFLKKRRYYFIYIGVNIKMEKARSIYTKSCPRWSLLSFIIVHILILSSSFGNFEVSTYIREDDIVIASLYYSPLFHIPPSPQ
jgi:hypothetical protein